LEESGRRFKLRTLLLIGFLALLVNSSYLASFAEPTLVYFANVALHPILGVVLAVCFGVLVLRRRGELPRALLAAALILGLGAAMGGYVLKYGATHAYRWALYTHIALSTIG
jgi:hypothetical protein